MRKWRWLGAGLIPVVAVIAFSAIPAPAPEQRATEVVPDTVTPEDLGITRQTVKVAVPAMANLLVLTRVYHHGHRDDANGSLYAIVLGQPAASWQWVSAGVFNPNKLQPEHLDKLKLMMPVTGGEYWVTASKPITYTSAVGSPPGAMEVGKNYELMTVRAGDVPMKRMPDGSEAGKPVAEWTISVVVRLEPMTEKQRVEREKAPGANLVECRDIDAFPKPFPDDLFVR